MNDKAFLTNAELELTQKWQMHFPRGIIPPNILKTWNGYPVESLTKRLTNFLLSLGQTKIISRNGIVAPPNGTVRLLTVPVNESCSWPDQDYIRDVGHKYPPTLGATERLGEVHIANFGDSHVSIQDVIAWGKTQHLSPASPRTCFAIAEHFPKLPLNLGIDLIAIISPKTCFFSGMQAICGVWWDKLKFKPGISRCDVHWGNRFLFAFVREVDFRFSNALK